MDQFRLITLTILITGLSSCSHSDEQHNHNSRSIENEQTENSETGLSLNNGIKWKANAETTSGVNNMIRLVDEFNKDDGDYDSLKSNLENEFTLIFQNCTMKGEAHNQLHHFLLPLKELFKGLDTEDDTVQKETIDQLRKHLSQYANFFE